MKIREVTIEDAQSIRELIGQLGYPHSEEFIESKLARIIASHNEEIHLYEADGLILGLVSVVYSIQLAFEDDFCNISYFVVNENTRGKQIGKQLEEYTCQRAKDRGCLHVEVFSLEKRTDAHRFYERQGYELMQKYLGKELK